LKIKRRLIKRVLASTWRVWFRQAEERVIRVRGVRVLCMISKLVNVRHAMGRWVRHAEEGIKIEERADREYERWSMIKKKEAMQRLRRH
jgi:hypothetical protein